ncbi:MAG: tol-pal system protein YbgF [Rhodospirillaceae bacterium]
MPKPLTTLLRTAGALALGAVLWTAPAAAQRADSNEVANRLNRLETELQTLQRQVVRGGAPTAGTAGASGSVAPTQAADFEIRLSQLERTVQDMVGKYEEAVFGATQMLERLEKMSSDIDFRLSQLESKTGTEGGPPPPPRTSATQTTPARTPAAATAPTAAAPAAAKPTDKPAKTAAAAPVAEPGSGGPGIGSVPGNVQDQYDEAFGLLRKADYDQAEKALTAFVTRHRDSPLAGNAQYWLGETYYVRGKYAEAAVAFAEGFQKHPKNPKAPDNLLKLGLSLASLNQRDDACKTFGQLASLFPNAAASLKRRADQERKKLSCS